MSSLRLTARCAAALVVAALACDSDSRPPQPKAHQGTLPPSARAPAPAPAAAPDPDEPDISDLARVARYAFREMQRGGGRCVANNPFQTPLHFVFEVQVEAARMVDMQLAEVALEQPGGLLLLEREQWPPELVTYTECVRPLLLAAEMSTPVPDGSFGARFGWAGSPSGRTGP